MIVKKRVCFKVKHNACGSEYITNRHNFLKGRSCNTCAVKARTKTATEFISEVQLITNEYTVLGEYVNSKVPIEMLHSTCGRTFFMKPGDFLNGNRCKKCYGYDRDFSEEVVKLEGDAYSVVGQFTKYNSKVKMRHNTCGYEYEAIASEFLRGCRCPKCNASKGEKAIEQFLKSRNIAYQSQYRIKECRHERSLPFDFAIFQNNTLYCLIEFDGKQHFIDSKFHRKKNGSLAFIQMKDAIKTDYCVRNNIKLIRIPYTEFDNIASILEEGLEAGI